MFILCFGSLVAVMKDCSENVRKFNKKQRKEKSNIEMVLNLKQVIYGEIA